MVTILLKAKEKVPKSHRLMVNLLTAVIYADFSLLPPLICTNKMLENKLKFVRVFHILGQRGVSVAGEVEK